MITTCIEEKERPLWYAVIIADSPFLSLLCSKSLKIRFYDKVLQRRCFPFWSSSCSQSRSTMRVYMHLKSIISDQLYLNSIDGSQGHICSSKRLDYDLPSSVNVLTHQRWARWPDILISQTVWCHWAITMAPHRSADLRRSWKFSSKSDLSVSFILHTNDYRKKISPTPRNMDASLSWQLSIIVSVTSVAATFRHLWWTESLVERRLTFSSMGYPMIKQWKPIKLLHLDRRRWAFPNWLSAFSFCEHNWCSELLIRSHIKTQIGSDVH